MTSRRAGNAGRGLRRLLPVRTITRPAAASGEQFLLRYTRTATEPGSTPVLVVPGGPGVGSVVPYLTLRRWAQAQAIDLVMVEHRGVGLSRRTMRGRDLDEDDMWLRLVVDDLRAVLDAESISRATLYGTSYGSYVAQAFAAEHPDRVAGLVLDSALLTTHDHNVVREHARALLWHGDQDGTRRLAGKLRALVGDGLVSQLESDSVARVVYELGGAPLLERLVDQVRAGRGRLAWRGAAALRSAETDWFLPLVMEFDLVGTIAFRELNFAPQPDGLPFDPGAAFARTASRFPRFEQEPYDLTAALARLTVPVVVLSGEWDLQTPPAVAEKIAGTAAQGHLVRVQRSGHSLLDSHPRAARAVLSTLSRRGAEFVPELQEQLNSLASRPHLFSVATGLTILLRLSALLPTRRGHLPRSLPGS